MFFIKNNKKGIVALPAVLVLGGIMIEISIIIALSMNFLVNSNISIRLSSQALAAARGGVYDGLLRVSRDKNFSSIYTMVFEDQSVEVEVCSVCLAQPGYYRVSATATVLTKKKKMEAILSINILSGVTQLLSFKEVAI